MGVAPTCLNDERRRDPEFDAAVHDAMEVACEEATGAAIERGIKGYLEPVVPGGHMVEYTDKVTGERKPGGSALLRPGARRSAPARRAGHPGQCQHGRRQPDTDGHERPRATPVGRPAGIPQDHGCLPMAYWMD